MTPTLDDRNGRPLHIGDYVEVLCDDWHCRGHWGGYTVLGNQLSFVTEGAIVTAVMKSGRICQRRLFRFVWDIRDVESIEVLEGAKA